MGSAISGRIKRKCLVYAFDKDKNKTKNLRGLIVTNDIADLVNRVDVVILAVKPQDFDSLLDEIKNGIKGKLVISIAAGITTGYIEKRLGQVRVIRVMPNMPARIGKGMSCLCKGSLARRVDLNFARHLFNCLGKTLVLHEEMMDAATAISGSGPGYFYDFIESHPQIYKNNPDRVLKEFIASLELAAKSLGFSHKEAMLLAKTTGTASKYLLVKTKLAPGELKRQVASRGGTTEAGIGVLRRGGSLEEAVKAALKRAKELTKKE